MPERVDELISNFPAAFAVMPGMAALLAPDQTQFTIVAVTDDYCRLTGMSRTSLTGASLLKFYPQLQDSLKKVLQTGQSDQLPPAHFSPSQNNGLATRYYTIYNKPIYSNNGQVQYIVHSLEDRTANMLTKKELLEKERRLELAMDISGLGNFMLDLQTRTANYSDKTMEWFGLTQQNESIDHIFSKIHPHDLPAVQAGIERSIAGDNNGGHDLTYRVVDRASGTRYLRSIGQVATENGNPISISGIIQDVTAEAQVSARLQESEARFRRIVEQAPVAIGIFRGWDFIIDVANQSLLELWNHTSEEVMGKKMFEAIPEVRGQGYEELLGNVLRTGEPFEAREAVVTLIREGVLQDVYLNFNFSALREPDGSVSAVMVVANDISVQVKARKDAEESEKRFSNLVREANSAIIVITGKELRVDIVNEAYARLLNLQPKDLEGRLLFDVIPEAEAFYRPIIEEVRITGKPIYLNDSPYSVVTNGQRISGYLHVVYQPYHDSDGKILGVMAIMQDVTESVKYKKALERSEAKFRFLIEEAPIATCLFVAEEMVVELANEAMLELWGKDKAALGLPLLEAVPELAGQNFMDILREVYHSGVTYVARSMPYILSRNSKPDTCYFDFTYKPLLNEEGNVYAIMNMAIDVTEQVMSRRQIEALVEVRTKQLASANEALQMKNDELSRSNASLEEFAHAASHDLKEPIRKIYVFTGQLKEELELRLSESETNILKRMENAAHRMVTLVDDLLLYSHVSHMPREKEAVDLNARMLQVLEDLELDIRDKNAEIEIGPLPTVHGFTRQLQQVFQNLIGNSLKYSREGVKPVIRIHGHEVQREGVQYHRICVSDNGIGFDQEHADKIFGIFARLHGKTEYSGTGVGLSIVKKVIENHGGKIEVKSKVNEGSEFCVLLLV